MKKKKKETPRSIMPDWKIIFGILIFIAILILILTGRATPSKINIFGVELEFANPTGTPIQTTSVMITPSLVTSPFPSNTPVIGAPIATATIEIPTLIPTPGTEDQLVRLVDNYFGCINEAKHDSDTD